MVGMPGYGIFTEGGMWLRFIRGGATKWYAKTPLGEIAYGEGQGLYEWTKDEVGVPYRIAHTGGDRQASSRGGKWTISGRPEPYDAGLEYALYQFNYGRN